MGPGGGTGVYVLSPLRYSTGLERKQSVERFGVPGVIRVEVRVGDDS